MLKELISINKIKNVQYFENYLWVTQMKLEKMECYRVGTQLCENHITTLPEFM